MATALTGPTPGALGFASPALGPWFSQDPVLGAPDNDLGVTVTFGSGDAWLPPTSGTLGFFITTPERPYAIAGLRRPDGSPAFHDDCLVAVFQLFPEVEERLHSLMRFVPDATAAPPATPVAAAAPTRPRVRTLALEFPTVSLDPSNQQAFMTALTGMISPAIPTYVTKDLSGDALRAAQAAYLGLEIADGRVRSGREPMADLKRPGRYYLPSVIEQNTNPEVEQLLIFTNPAGVNARLFAFDDRGLPLDPGAVAAWWNYLATQVFTNLWATGLNNPPAPATSEWRTARVTAGVTQFTVHLLDAHGGRIADDDPVLERLNLTGVQDGNPKHLPHSTGGAVSFGFNGPADANLDDAPVPLVAVLPEGSYAGQAQLWNGWATPPFTRDFVQVSLLDAEYHLVGVRRTAPQNANDVVKRRAADQNRPTTRVLTERAAGTVLQADATTAAAGVIGVFATGTPPVPTTLVASALDLEYGAVAPLAALPTPATLPDPLPAMAGNPPTDAKPLRDAGARTVGWVHPLRGGDEMEVVVQLELGNALAGAWVRAWNHAFEAKTGSRTRRSGGGGRTNGNGRVWILLKLEKAADGAAAPLGLDLLIKTANANRFYADLRFNLPTPQPSLASQSWNTANLTVHICETGTTGLATSIAGQIPPGASVIALDGNPPIPSPIVRSTIPAGAFLQATLLRAAGAMDTLVLTQPAFKDEPQGTATADTDFPAGNRPTVKRMVRTTLDALKTGQVLAAGEPLPTQQRLEVAAAAIDTGNAAAALATTPALARSQELPPHQEGHPGAPAAPETAGTGVALTGSAALQLAEYVRDRKHWWTHELLFDAGMNAFPALAPPAGPATHVAVLRTAARGSEGEPQLSELADALIKEAGTDSLGTFGTNTQQTALTYTIPIDPGDSWFTNTVIAGLNALLGAVQGWAGGANPFNDTSASRALDRRLQAARGIREAALSLLPAVQRAQNFIYIETPALDTLAISDGDEKIHLWQALLDRLKDPEHRTLKLILCLPLELGADAPKPLREVRNGLLRKAIEELRTIPHFDRRVAIFTPNAGPGRPLHLASTTVIIDDAYLLTGSTHLWRRGLSYDSSIAVALFDETLSGGRPAAIQAFRNQLIAARLGLMPALLPQNPADLLEALRLLTGRDAGRRLTTRSVLAAIAKAKAEDSHIDTWVPDGSLEPNINIEKVVNTMGYVP